MRTTLNLDDQLIKELMQITGARTKTEAIHQAIAAFIRQKRLEGLKALSGKVRLDLDWRTLEKQELKAQEQRERRLRGHR